MRLEIFRGRLGWYWRLRARNGRIVAISAEPFASKSNARLAFRVVRRAVSGYDDLERA